MTQARINLLLASLVLFLGALLLFEPENDSREEPAPLSELSPDQINQIRRSGPSGETLTLERQGQGWGMVAPYRVAADAARVRGLLAIARQPSQARFAAVPAELAGFGLDPPGILLALDGEQFGFGRTDPVYFRRYVLHRDEVHLIEDYGYRHLIATPEAFVSRHLLEAGTEILTISAPTLNPQGLGWHRPQVESDPTTDTRAMSRIWQETEALEVRKVPTRATGAAVELWLKGREKPLVFLRAAAQPELLIRPDLGLGYRVTADAPVLQIFQAAIAPPPP